MRRPEEAYGSRELVEIGKGLTTIPGLQCAWIHPRVDSTFSAMIRFYHGQVPSKNFFSLMHGYNNWAFLNNEYQVPQIHFVRGWNRALLNFEGGLTCR